jgi:hypothetical protein
VRAEIAHSRTLRPSGAIAPHPGFTPCCECTHASVRRPRQRQDSDARRDHRGDALDGCGGATPRRRPLACATPLHLVRRVSRCCARHRRHGQGFHGSSPRQRTGRGERGQSRPPDRRQRRLRRARPRAGRLSRRRLAHRLRPATCGGDRPRVGARRRAQPRPARLTVAPDRRIGERRPHRDRCARGHAGRRRTVGEGARPQPRQLRRPDARQRAGDGDALQRADGQRPGHPWPHRRPHPRPPGRRTHGRPLVRIGRSRALDRSVQRRSHRGHSRPRVAPVRQQRLGWRSQRHFQRHPHRRADAPYLLPWRSGGIGDAGRRDRRRRNHSARVEGRAHRAWHLAEHGRPPRGRTRDARQHRCLDQRWFDRCGLLGRSGAGRRGVPRHLVRVRGPVSHGRRGDPPRRAPHAGGDARHGQHRRWAHPHGARGRYRAALRARRDRTRRCRGDQLPPQHADRQRDGPHAGEAPDGDDRPAGLLP